MAAQHQQMQLMALLRGIETRVKGMEATLKSVSEEVVRVSEAQSLLLERVNSLSEGGIAASSGGVAASGAHGAAAADVAKSGGGPDKGGVAVVSGADVAKAVLAEMDRRALEEKRTCVQCNAEYQEHANTDTACNFHAGPIVTRGWNCTFTCCQKKAGGWDKPFDEEKNCCQRSRHMDKHHRYHRYANYNLWASETAKKCDRVWGVVTLMDHEAKRKLLAAVLYSTTSMELTVVLSSQYGLVDTLHRFSAEDVQAIGKKNVELIDSIEPTDPPYQLRAEWRIVDSAVRGVVLTCQTSTGASAGDPPLRRLVHLHVEDVSKTGDGTLQSSVAQGQSPLRVVYDERVDDVSQPPMHDVSIMPESEALAQYGLPKSERTGPEIDPGPPHPGKLPRHRSEGTSTLRLKQQPDEVEAHQDTWGRDGRFHNYVTAYVLVANPSDAEASVTSVSAEYQTHDQTWAPVDLVIIGQRNPQSRRVTWLEDRSTHFRIEAGGAVTYAMQAGVLVTGTPGFDNEHRNRVHRSLPQPFRVRFTVTDVQGKDVSLVCEQHNRPLRIATAESVQRDKFDASKTPGARLSRLVWCDDTNRDERMWVAVGHKQRFPMIISGSTHKSVVPSEFAQVLYRALKSKETVIVDEGLSSESNKERFTRIEWLVDLAARRVYGVRIVLTSPTGSTTETLPIPEPPAGPPVLSLEPPGTTVVQQGSTLRVRWTEADGHDGDWLAVFAPHAVDTDYTGRTKRSKADKAGIIEVPVPKAPGTYEVRAFSGSAYGGHSRFEPSSLTAPLKFTVK